jgi:hypothetical protein
MVNPGFYRGIVVNNVDPDNKGNCKVYVPGVYPGAGLTDANILPWAEPVMPVFGGAGLSTSDGVKFSSTGWTSVPGVGTYVWVFFEGNDQNYPRFFAAAQAGDAWMSEHEMQHVLSTENFRITIDENPANSSTMKTDTVDGNKTNQNTRARIEIESDAVALDLVIKGDVNILIDGDKYEKITGNRYTEVSGNDTPGKKLRSNLKPKTSPKIRRRSSAVIIIYRQVDQTSRKPAVYTITFNNAFQLNASSRLRD